MTQQHQRRRIFIDRPVQGALLLRAALYWAVSLVTQLLIVLLYVSVTSSADDFDNHRARVWWHIQLTVVASSAILPVILLDVLKLSHRWVGPVFRMRSALRSLTRGEPFSPIRFREDDFWQELAIDLSTVTAELNRHRANSREDDKPTELDLDPNAQLDRREAKLENDAAPAPFAASGGALPTEDSLPTVPMADGWSAIPTSTR